MKKLSLLLLFLSVSAYAQLTAPAAQIVIPAAGSVAGLNGTFFRSDIAVFNYRDVPQNVAVQWLPQGISGQSVQTRLITIAARSGIISEDFVANILQQTGLGAIVFTAVTSEAAPDANGDVKWSLTLPLPAESGSASTLVAFVQNPGAGEVLQALALPLTAACAPER